MASAHGFSCFKGGRHKTPAAYLDVDNWPPFDDTVLKGTVLERFLRLKKAIQAYMRGMPLAAAATLADLGVHRLRTLFYRCGTVLPNGQIAGWSALVQGRALEPRLRKAEAKPDETGKGGFSGAFRKLLNDHKEISEELTSYLNAFGLKGLRPNRMQLRGICRQFVRICERQGIKPNEYPLNTRHRARKSLRRWIDTDYLPQYANRFLALEHGPDAGKLNAYAEGDGQANAAAAPYSVWICDEVTVDILARYEFPNETGDWEELDLARFFHVRLIEQGGANLASRQVFAPQANADDLTTLFWDAVSGPPEPPKPLKDQILLEGAGYPSVVIEKLRWAIPSVIMLDRALAHLADHVQHIATVLFGARVILGPGGTPHERAQVESRFSVMARRLVHQMPATTGSGPGDPMRKRADVPVLKRLHATEVEQLLDANARNENITPQAAAGNIAPLVRLQRQLASGVLQPIYLAPEKRKPHFFARPVRVKVKADRAKGVRPYIHYLYARYSSTELSKDYSMEGKELLSRPDLRNLRTVMLFRMDGTFYCSVQVLGRWGAFPHDQRLRRLYGRLKREGQLGDRADDLPLEAIFAHLRKKAPRDRKAALQLTYFIEYLLRNEVALSPEMTLGVRNWQALKQEAANLATLPVVPVPPQPLSSADSPAAMPRLALPSPAAPAAPALDAPLAPEPSKPALRLVPPAPVGQGPAKVYRPRPNIPR